MSCKQASSKQSKVVSYNRSMLLLIGSNDEGALKKLLHFAIQRAKTHDKCLLKSTLIVNVSIKVSPHSSKRVIRCRDFEGLSDEPFITRYYRRQQNKVPSEP